MWGTSMILGKVLRSHSRSTDDDGRFVVRAGWRSAVLVAVIYFAAGAVIWHALGGDVVGGVESLLQHVFGH